MDDVSFREARFVVAGLEATWSYCVTPEPRGWLREGWTVKEEVARHTSEGGKCRPNAYVCQLMTFCDSSVSCTPPPPLPYQKGGGWGWSILESLRPSVLSCVRVSELVFLSFRYLLNRSTIFSQTWYCGVLSRCGVSCRNIGALSSMSGHCKGLYYQNMTISTISSKRWSVCNQTWFGSTS